MVEIKEDDEKGEDTEGKIVRIKVTWETRERLKMLGKKGDTYEVIIQRLMKEALK